MPAQLFDGFGVTPVDCDEEGDGDATRDAATTVYVPVDVSHVTLPVPVSYVDSQSDNIQEAPFVVAPLQSAKK